MKCRHHGLITTKEELIVGKAHWSNTLIIGKYTEQRFSLSNGNYVGGFDFSFSENLVPTPSEATLKKIHWVLERRLVVCFLSCFPKWLPDQILASKCQLSVCLLTFPHISLTFIDLVVKSNHLCWNNSTECQLSSFEHPTISRQIYDQSTSKVELTFAQLFQPFFIIIFQLQEKGIIPLKVLFKNYHNHPLWNSQIPLYFLS